jgi:23S rRNA C2498 (ribose-2'-O)-methylase RlmM
MVTFASEPAVKAAFYEVSQIAGKWSITRKDGHVFCLCRSHEEASRLMRSLNDDQQKFPKEHK